jgi:hypothetical protein
VWLLHVRCMGAWCRDRMGPQHATCNLHRPCPARQVKLMNRMVRYAKCVAVRDKQVVVRGAAGREQSFGSGAAAPCCVALVRGLLAALVKLRLHGTARARGRGALQEKAQAEAAAAAEQRRLDAEMEVERLRALAAYSGRDAQRRAEQERGAAILREQLAERGRQRMAEEELRDQERAQMQRELERLAVDEARAAADKRARAHVSAGLGSGGQRGPL